jgi:AhpD family alkylhydroperoxidase
MNTQQQFKALADAAFQDGALSAKTKELIAFAMTHVTQSQACHNWHLRRALNLGATEAELTEAMWVAIVMRAAGGLGGSGIGAEQLIQNAARSMQVGKAQ